MKVLHTADWHLGQVLRGYGREAEMAAAVEWLVEQAGNEQPDALLVAGDVFDGPNPRADDLKLFYKTLVALHHSAPQMQTVIIAGNHDSAGRLEAVQDLLTPLNVHVVGNVRRPDGELDHRRHLIPIGNAVGHVLAVSYPTTYCLPVVEGPIAGRLIPQRVKRLYEEMLEGTRERWEGGQLAVMGHLHVRGGQESPGAERKILVGGEDAVGWDVFGGDAQYVALGHLHRAQEIDSGRVQYSGSLLPLSAAEVDYEHGVTVVEIGRTGVRSRRLRVP